MDDLADGWEVWSEERHRVVLAYRPDVFDSQSFPAPCLPTIYVIKGRPGRRPGRHVPDPDDEWRVTLYLEPEVEGGTETFGSRAAALAGANDLARQFARGGIDYRGLYQVPREEYLEELDDRTGREA